MIKVIHDINHTMFREPAGARRAGSPVSLTLLTARDLQAPAPVLHVRFDKDESHRILRMEEADQSPGTDGSGRGGMMPLPGGAAGAASHGQQGGASYGQQGGASYGQQGGANYGQQGGASYGQQGGAAPFGLYRAWTVSFTPERSGLYWYWFELGGLSLIGCDPETGQAVLADHPQAWQLTVYSPAYADPDWIRGGVFYHVFVDRFASAGERVHMEGKVSREDWGGMPEWRPDCRGEILNNDFFGGNLAGLRQKLPYLEDLGVTCLYLSPIFEAYSSHKYDTTDYMKVDPMFGDEQEFTRLCGEAAARGIRVICDGVFSHTGSDSRYFDIRDRFGSGACHHPDSPYRDWYYFEPDGSWQSWWGIKTLPRVNKDVPSYQEFMAGEDGVIRHWLRAGASGWRLDVVDELPRTFLEKLTAAAKAEKSDALMLGEVWEDASNKIAYDERKNYFEGDKLDSVMNYPLRRGIIEYVREGDAMALARPMAMITDHYPDRVIHAMMNILGTHDTERIITALAGQKLGPDAGREEKARIRMDADQWTAGIRRLKTAVVLQMTLPGVPCIYYGDEAGMEGYNDPFNRCCYPWGHENRELQDWYRRVIAIRRSSAVYRDGSYRLLAARDGLFAFERRVAELTDARDSAQRTDPVTDVSRDNQRPDTMTDVRRDNQRTDTMTDARRDAGAADADCRITVTNCGSAQQYLPLQGRWQDLLSGITWRNDVLILPGQAMILQPVCTPKCAAALDPASAPACAAALDS